MALTISFSFFHQQLVFSFLSRRQFRWRKPVSGINKQQQQQISIETSSGGVKNSFFRYENSLHLNIFTFLWLLHAPKANLCLFLHSDTIKHDSLLAKSFFARRRSFFVAVGFECCELNEKVIRSQFSSSLDFLVHFLYSCFPSTFAVFPSHLRERKAPWKLHGNLKIWWMKKMFFSVNVWFIYAQLIFFLVTKI